MKDFFLRYDGANAGSRIWLIFLITFLLGLLLHWISCRCRSYSENEVDVNPTPAPEPQINNEPEPVIAQTPQPQAFVPAAASVVDDLKKIEGIGPKIESLLNAGGIKTFQGLVDIDLSIVQKILNEAGPRYRIHDPATWAKQAVLAAQGKWEELDEYQDRLKGGREV